MGIFLVLSGLGVLGFLGFLGLGFLGLGRNPRATFEPSAPKPTIGLGV